MRIFLTKLLASSLLGLTVSLSWASTNDPLLGYWRTIDDETGFAKAIVQIQEAQNGTYLSTIVATVDRPDYVAAEKCINCPAPFTDRKIVGLPILWNLSNSDQSTRGKEKRYAKGFLIDPLSGKFYQISARLSGDARRLTLRGHIIGVPFIGRTQTWIRETNYSPKK